jgi:hypothetical protein
LLLRRLRNKAAKKQGTAVKQKTIKDFFLWKFKIKFIIIIYERQTALLYYPNFRLSEVASVHTASDNWDCTVYGIYISADYFFTVTSDNCHPIVNSSDVNVRGYWYLFTKL